MDNKINFYGFETGVLLEKLDKEFLTHYAQMRWDTTDKGVITDTEKIKEKSAEEILQLIFS